MGTDKTAVTQKKGMNTITIQVGKKDSGKTNFCKISLMTQKPNRALILDIDNEYTDYPFLKDRSFLNSNEKGIYRINFHPKRI